MGKEGATDVTSETSRLSRDWMRSHSPQSRQLNNEEWEVARGPSLQVFGGSWAHVSRGC